MLSNPIFLRYNFMKKAFENYVTKFEVLLGSRLKNVDIRDFSIIFKRDITDVRSS